MSIALAVLPVVIQPIGINVCWLTLCAGQKRLDTITRAQLQATSPNMPMILDPPAQMRHRVEQLRPAADKSVPEDFLPLADRFAQTATGLVPDALLMLDHHDHTLTVTLKDGTGIAGLRTAARNVGPSMNTAEAPHGAEATMPGSCRTVPIAQQQIFHGDIPLFLPIIIPPPAAHWRAGPGTRCSHDALDAA